MLKPLKHLTDICQYSVQWGFVSLIEGICVDKQLGGRTLQAKIDALATLLPENIVDNLHAFRFMGNEAAHDLESPSYQQLQLALDICDDLLNYLYDLDYKTGELANPRHDQ